MKQFDGLIWAALFIIFGALQYNDPDAITWILIYAAAAVIGILTYYQKLSKVILWLMFGVFLIAAGLLWPDEYQGLTLDMGYSPAIEEARESLGLGICALGMIWLALRYRK